MHFVIPALVGLVGWAATDAFGLLHGLGVTAAVYLLMPYDTARARR